jgi:hypothetical protein
LSPSAARSTGSIPSLPEKRSIAPSRRAEGFWVCRASSVEDGRNPWLKAFNAVREALAPFAVNGVIEDVVEAQAEVFERLRTQ